MTIFPRRRKSFLKSASCKRLNFRGLKFSRIGPKLKIRNYSRVLIFANGM
ncbi:MAG: hypothetical protein PV344_03995 [Anaplasma sp.]|nr:hypothetical protein [Anaplasma sp.]